MAGVPTISEFECPVCHEDYTEPKILPCAHLACRNCVISWLGKGGGQAGCPMCRAPILSPTRPGQGDLATLVDALPTDLASVALVESDKVLRSPNICMICQPNDVKATSYCFQCDVKLCHSCKGYHEKLPATKDHTLEQLDKLSAKQLAENRRLTCKIHPDRSAELYCSNHKNIICILCGTTSHGNCTKKTIGDVATEKRAELRKRAQELRKKEAEISTQIKEVKAKFEDMRGQTKDTFNRLQQLLEKRRKEVNSMIQDKESATIKPLAEREKARVALALNAGTVENLVESAPDGPLLSMACDLTSRLNDLESQTRMLNRIIVADLPWNRQAVAQLEAGIAAFGTRATPRNAEQATVRPMGFKRGCNYPPAKLFSESWY